MPTKLNSQQSNNLAFCLAAEKLMTVEIPPRAQAIRVIMAELSRVQNHLVFVGMLLNDLGAFFTPALYAIAEREKILDFFEATAGSRMMCNYMRFGGCRVDLPAGWLDAAKQIVANYPRFLDEFERLLTGNEILMARTQHVGVLPQRLAAVERVDVQSPADCQLEKLVADLHRQLARRAEHQHLDG